MLSTHTRHHILRQIGFLDHDSSYRLAWFFDKRIRVVKVRERLWLVYEHDPDTGRAFPEPVECTRQKAALAHIEAIVASWPVPEQKAVAV